MILIIGSEGSMGKRYQAILRHLKEEFVRCDKVDGTLPLVSARLLDYQGVIVCTPTDTHTSILNYLEAGEFNGRVLCEKPLTKSMPHLDYILNLKIDLTCMMQYSVLDDPNAQGPSHYNYFRHGNDGLVWDCFQVIALARGKVAISEDSPVWSCRLNGKKLFLSDMDDAYVKFVKGWLLGSIKQSSSLLRDWHYKVNHWKTNDECNDRDSGAQ